MSVEWHDPDSGGALGGVRVLDLSRVLAGPYLTMLLGDLGADVIKVERPDGDDTRGWGPPHFDGDATYFLAVNRNKRTLVADLRQERDREAVLRLARRADVVVENFRPGVADRLGVGEADIRALAPAVVYCSISAFGDAPQARALPGYDLLVQAVGGMMSVTGTQESGPTKAGVAVVDVLAGLHASSGVLAALRHAERTGEGQHVRVSLLGTALASLVNQSSAYLLTGTVPGRMGNAHPSLAPYETYRCADGEIVLAVGNDRQFRDLVGAIDAPGLAEDPRFATNADRVAHRDALRTTLERLFATADVGTLVPQLLARGVPAGAVNDLAGAFAHAEGLGLDVIAEVGEPGRTVRTAASPMRLSSTPVTYRTPPPRLPPHGSGGPH
ncbi:CaiB/BaiF CoA transferase family protein [Janibacter sp. GS2]|uniref:CaiB/BaiF CoA transferase family protein n=1 Tax=Janibacter sp. GS2 TaxID=3442646 RepID=UPI003EB7B85C